MWFLILPVLRGLLSALKPFLLVVAAALIAHLLGVPVVGMVEDAVTQFVQNAIA